MFNVWFCDLEKAIKAFQAACPSVDLFQSIDGNVYGDFIIRTDSHEYIVNHKDFSVWVREGDWKGGDWVKVS